MKHEIKIIRRWVVFFIVALALSGITAMPAEQELAYLCAHISRSTQLGDWLYRVYTGVAATNAQYPFLAYGYDWLAFAHLVLALLFIGVYRNPVRNKWIIEFGMMCCLLIIPFAFITGSVRGIPIGWRLIDCSFGIAGLIPLSICLLKIIKIEDYHRVHSIISTNPAV